MKLTHEHTDFLTGDASEGHATSGDTSTGTGT
jgi:hypothetical protein